MKFLDLTVANPDLFAGRGADKLEVDFVELGPLSLDLIDDGGHAHRHHEVGPGLVAHAHRGLVGLMAAGRAQLLRIEAGQLTALLRQHPHPAAVDHGALNVLDEDLSVDVLVRLVDDAAHAHRRLARLSLLELRQPAGREALADQGVGDQPGVGVIPLPRQVGLGLSVHPAHLPGRTRTGQAAHLCGQKNAHGPSVPVHRMPFV